MKFAKISALTTLKKRTIDTTIIDKHITTSRFYYAPLQSGLNLSRHAVTLRNLYFFEIIIKPHIFYGSTSDNKKLCCQFIAD